MRFIPMLQQQQHTEAIFNGAHKFVSFTHTAFRKLYLSFHHYCMVFFVVIASCQIEMINCDYWHSLFTRPTILLLISLPSGHSCIKTNKRSQQISMCACHLFTQQTSDTLAYCSVQVCSNMTGHLFYCVSIGRKKATTTTTTFKPEKKRKNRNFKWSTLGACVCLGVAALNWLVILFA